MSDIPFVKYTSFGNNFVIVDESDATILSEAGKSAFASQATDMCFGIGSDNLLVIQRYSAELLAQINQARAYWDRLPVDFDAHYIFRMFEPDGTEALCCGNGLMCIASYLYHRHGIDQARVMTETPLATPNVVSLGVSHQDGRCWVDMGSPRRLPPSIMPLDLPLSAAGESLQTIKNLTVEFRSHDLQPIASTHSLLVSGHLVFTGEPHMVVFVENDLSLPQLTDSIFASPHPRSQSAREKRSSFGTWLVDHIGHYINRYYADIFPMGISVSFVLFDSNGNDVWYRCFERGINRETLACGTGALAVAYITQKIYRPDNPRIVVRPFRCSWHQPGAKMIVEENANGWSIQGQPVKLMEGYFSRPSLAATTHSNGGAIQAPSIPEICDQIAFAE